MFSSELTMQFGGVAEGVTVCLPALFSEGLHYVSVDEVSGTAGDAMVFRKLC
jgi:hypothetical protein